jgi:hypothetical protein
MELRRAEVWQRVARTFWSLVVVGGLLAFLIGSLYLKSTQCYDDCYSDGADGYTGGDNRYTAQLVLACVGTSLGLTAVVAGFVRRGWFYYFTGTTAAVVWVVWLGWATSSSF